MVVPMACLWKLLELWLFDATRQQVSTEADFQEGRGIWDKPRKRPRLERERERERESASVLLFWLCGRRERERKKKKAAPCMASGFVR